LGDRADHQVLAILAPGSTTVRTGEPGLIGAAFALLDTAFGLFALPESLDTSQRRPLALRDANPFGAVAFFRVDATLAVLAAALFVLMFAHQFWAIWALYATYRYG
jgi:DHA1 family tetracycline resistance protein-like MFS transporter